MEPTMLDQIEARMVELGGEVRQRGDAGNVAPVTHKFTPGMYIREIFMPAGSIITSELHITEHPYVVSAGRCYVYMEPECEWVLVQAPHSGITKPGTRRFLVIVFDTIWTTFHATEETDVEKIENNIFGPNENPLIHALRPGDRPREIAA